MRFCVSVRKNKDRIAVFYTDCCCWFTKSLEDGSEPQLDNKWRIAMSHVSIRPSLNINGRGMRNS